MKPEDLTRTPLLTEAGATLLEKIRQHSDAPRWNHELGDRVTAEDLAAVATYRHSLRARPVPAPVPVPVPVPDPSLLHWITAMRPRVTLFRENIPEGLDLSRDFASIRTSSRQDLATRLADVIPFDLSLDRILTYDTSGTTGHALQIPHHPRALALNHALCELALERHGITPPFTPGTVACINLRASVDCFVFANVFSVWNQSGFVRLNLHPSAWPGGLDAARRFIEAFPPAFFTGDPIAFDELARLGPNVRPMALLSTAVTLEPAHAQRLSAHFGCPVIDWYSSTETGPIAATCPGVPGHAILPSDLHVEIVGEDPEDDDPRPPGVRGEIAVTGGRNPYLPLLRYRTGDRASLALAPIPHLVGLEGRAATFFRAADGTPVNAVDVGRALRVRAVFVQHAFVQRADGSLTVTLRPAHGIPIDTRAIQHDLERLFAGAPCTVTVDANLGQDGGKVIPYRSEPSPTPPG